MHKNLKIFLNFKSETGSMILVVIMGLAIISGALAMASAYLNKTKSTIVKTNTYLDIENMKSLLLTYLSNSAVCAAHFESQNLVSGNAFTDKIFYIQNVGGVTTLLPGSPMTLINTDASAFTIPQTDVSNFNNSFLTELNFIYKINDPLYTKNSKIKIQVELNNIGQIINCKSYLDVAMTQALCTADNRGKITIDAQNIPRVCNGTAWVPATQSGGFYRFYTDTTGGIGQCQNPNEYTGDCSCPPDFTPRLVVDFESRNCEWRYFDYGSGAGCGTKGMECVYGI